MKTITKPFLLVFFVLVSLFSCNKENIFVEESLASTKETQASDEAASYALPCDFNLNNAKSNATILINCTLDLQGKTIDLPPKVDIAYEGGEIKNGTLNFSEDSVIDSEILNTTLNIGGTKPQLRDLSFTFDPERWGIVQGVVSDEVALRNRDILQKTIYQAKLFGVNVFKIDKMDAYFKVHHGYTGRSTRLEDTAINIPSDFSLNMTDNTFIRVQPNELPWYTLIKLPISNNVSISGGHLVGDRFQHVYKPYSEDFGNDNIANRDHHTFGSLLFIIGSENVEVDNVHFSDPTGDAIMFHGEALRQASGELFPGKKETKNVIVKNCTMLRSRRNAISFLDGRDIIIDNCIISDTGNGEQAYDASGKRIYSSSGASPRYGIDFEAIRTSAEDGSLVRSALNEDIIVRNCKFTNNYAGDIVVFTASYVTIENNNFDSKVASFASDNVIVRNNAFKSREKNGLTAFTIGSYINKQGVELNDNWEFYNNTITDYAKGMTIGGKNHDIRNNKIENCAVGVFLISNLSNTTFRDNVITSNVLNSKGYRNLYNTRNNKNVSILGETISVEQRPIDLYYLNQDADTTSELILFKDCDLTSAKNFSNSVRRSKHVTFENNISNTEYTVKESENIKLTGNKINKIK